jgi:hypothetical protein
MNPPQNPIELLLHDPVTIGKINAKMEPDPKFGDNANRGHNK